MGSSLRLQLLPVSAKGVNCSTVRPESIRGNNTHYLPCTRSRRPLKDLILFRPSTMNHFRLVWKMTCPMSIAGLMDSPRSITISVDNTFIRINKVITLFTFLYRLKIKEYPLFDMIMEEKST